MISKKFLLWVGTVLAAIALLATFVMWRQGWFSDQPAGFTAKDFADEAAAATAKMHGPAPVAQSVPERIEASRQLRLAIGSVGLEDEQRSRSISDLALVELTGAKGLELVERQELDAVLRELQLNVLGLTRARDAIRAGKLLRADWFLLGTPAKVDGTNVGVIRIVDARTGVMRDATMIATAEAAPAFASALARFVRQAREDAANPKAKSYLAIGGLEDLSLNSRQATVPRELRSYLTAAYQNNSGVALLEREFVNTLLREVYLDLAGLTEESATKEPQPMQAAYWIVDGSYQSYETTNLQVELVLNVRRLMGRSERIELREKPGEPLFRSVKATIDRTMEQNRADLAFSRQTEVRALVGNGRSLARLDTSDQMNYVWISYAGYRSDGQNEAARQVRNAEEAVRAFETVLLLEPTNREARIYLATCFRKYQIERMDDARNYYREVIDMPIEDQWSGVAREALVFSFEGANPNSRKKWFETAALGATSRSAREFYQTNAQRAVEDEIVEMGGSKQGEELAEVRLFEKIKSFDNVIHGKSGASSFAVGMDAFLEVFGDNRARAARRLVELFPKMKAEFPDAAPYLLATIVTFQADTNTPIIAEFEQTLDWAAEHPEKVVCGGTVFWRHIRYEPYAWALKHQVTPLAVKILESIFRASATDQRAESGWGNDDKMALAYGYLSLERWKDALALFESYANEPLLMGSSGPWGRAFSIILTSKQAALCREKLGLPPVIDPREFNLGEPILCLHDPSNYWRSGDSSVFATTTDGLWIGLNDQLMQVDFNLRTNFVVRLPGNSSELTVLQVGESNVWIGTAGDGLIEIDKTSRKIRNFREREGLLMDYISSLHQVGDTLWIGYGNTFGGGLGKLDLQSQKFTSFTPSLSSKVAEGQPPRQVVSAIQTGPTGDVWFVNGGALSRFRPSVNAWEYFPTQNGLWLGNYVLDKDRLIEGLGIRQVELTIVVRSNTAAAVKSSIKIKRIVSVEEYSTLQATLNTNRGEQRISSSSDCPPKGGLARRNLRDGSQTRLTKLELFWSTPTAMTLDGQKLWVGGQGFVALVDLTENKIKKLAYVPARNIDQIQIGGGFLWVLYGKHIYRVPLRDLG